MDTDPYSGEYLWWSNRADESNTKLTKVVKLPSAEHITLDFFTWYHIEEDWDYAYVVVGSSPTGSLPDNLDSDGIRWEILDDDALNCTTSNPNNGNLGCGLTGKSAGWQNLSADLTKYKGQEIALRFEYITDAAVNQAGLALDDLRIKVDGEVFAFEDAEDENENWIADGFVRHANLLPQDWIVQLIWHDGPSGVKRLLFLDETQGSWIIPFNANRDEAIIAISALAPTTTEIGSYEYSLSPTK
jgi:immune inhibitor A